jgi:hypothetical protein
LPATRTFLMCTLLRTALAFRRCTPARRLVQLVTPFAARSRSMPSRTIFDMSTAIPATTNRPPSALASVTGSAVGRITGRFRPRKRTDFVTTSCSAYVPAQMAMKSPSFAAVRAALIVRYGASGQSCASSSTTSVPDHAEPVPSKTSAMAATVASRLTIVVPLPPEEFSVTYRP